MTRVGVPAEKWQGQQGGIDPRYPSPDLEQKRHKASPQTSLWEGRFATSLLGAHFPPFCQEACQELPDAPLIRWLRWPDEDLRIILIINQQPSSRRPERGEIQRLQLRLWLLCQEQMRGNKNSPFSGKQRASRCHLQIHLFRKR